jgi:hypothetical protein
VVMGLRWPLLLLLGRKGVITTGRGSMSLPPSIRRALHPPLPRIALLSLSPSVPAPAVSRPVSLSALFILFLAICAPLLASSLADLSSLVHHNDLKS